MPSFSLVDWAVVAVYFAIVFLTAVFASRRSQGPAATADYFLAGRNAGWFLVGASLFASNIGAEHLVGLAGSGAAGGVAVAQFEILAGLMLLLLGWFFVPFYLRSGVFTMPEFLERRYSSGPRTFLAIISIVGYVLTKIAVTIAAGGIVFEALMGIDFWTGAVIVVLATGLYTIWGGLRAVLYTDALQLVVFLGGAVAVTAIGLHEVGGWQALRASAGSDHYDLWKPVTHPDFPWTGIIFGAPIIGVWYWCTDQFIVQRVLAARNEAQARRGTIFAGLLKQLPLFVFVLPGIIAFVLARTGTLTLERPDEALPALIGALLPSGLKGLAAAGLLAALMSTLSSVFNSCSTLFAFDVYKRFHPSASDRTLVHVGRIATLILVGLALAWIPFMELVSGQLYTYLQSVQSYISPPIAAVFLIGLLSKRVNARGAVAALAVGFVLGVARLVLEMNDERLTGALRYVADINYLHFALLLFVISSAVLVLASLTAPSPSVDKLRIVAAGARAQSIGKADVLGTAALLVAIVAIWIYFSG